MKWLQRIFRNDKNVIWALVAFVAFLLMLFAIVTRADAADSRLEFTGGSAVMRGNTPFIGLDLSYPLAGPVNTDYEFGFRLVGSSTYKGEEQPNNIHLHAALVDGWKKFEMGLGLAYVSQTDRYNGDHLNFWLMLRLRATDRLRVQYEHVSCAGSCAPNLGRDLIGVAWNF